MGDLGIPTGLDISDADAAVGDVKDPKTFYAGAEPKKTGNLATVALAAGSNAYPAGYHAGEANLVAVDADLVAANIADGITIFGVVGTLVAGSLAEDVLGSVFGHAGTDTSATYWSKSVVIADGADLDLSTTTPTFDATSLAVGVAVCAGRATASNRLKLRLIMGGVQVAESGYIDTSTYNLAVMGTRALSGSQACISRLHAYADGASYEFFTKNEADFAGGGIAVGSVKLV